MPAISTCPAIDETHGGCPRRRSRASCGSACEIRGLWWAWESSCRWGPGLRSPGSTPGRPRATRGGCPGEVCAVTGWSRDNARRRLTQAAKRPGGAKKEASRPRGRKYRRDSSWRRPPSLWTAMDLGAGWESEAGSRQQGAHPAPTRTKDSLHPLRPSSQPRCRAGSHPDHRRLDRQLHGCVPGLPLAPGRPQPDPDRQAHPLPAGLCEYNAKISRASRRSDAAEPSLVGASSHALPCPPRRGRGRLLAVPARFLQSKDHAAAAIAVP